MSQRTCPRCKRPEGTVTCRGNPLRFYGPRSKHAGYCIPCVNVMRDYPDRPAPTPRPTRCRICKRKRTRNNRPLPIIKTGQWPGLCTACRNTLVRRTRTYPVTPCADCGRTHTRNGRVLELTRTGDYAGLCGTCRHRKWKREQPPLRKGSNHAQV